MSDVQEAKKAIDKVINKGRVHFYKPIQIAEILHHSRVEGAIDASELEHYRTESRAWRDKVSQKLVGNVSTSSARYQDDLFNENAVPPRLLSVLDQANRSSEGMVENYIYQRLSERWGVLARLGEALEPPFSFEDFLEAFETSDALKQSVDKAYEISAYALFRAVTRALEVTVTLEVGEPDPQILADFSDFITRVLGIPADEGETVFAAEIYRLGVANAADTGVDILTNFGPAIQVKHVSLDPELCREIVQPLEAANVVIVCLDADKQAIDAVLKQLGLRDRVQAVITVEDLSGWYELALEKHRETVGANLVSDLRSEFEREFPHISEVPAFMDERDYRRGELRGIWQLDEPAKQMTLAE